MLFEILGQDAAILWMDKFVTVLVTGANSWQLRAETGKPGSLMNLNSERTLV
jgi:hypothetical protein